MPELSEARQVIMGRVTDVITKTAEFKNSLDTYAYLWVDDRSEFMKQFLLYGHMLAPEETEARADIGSSDDSPITQQFKEQARKRYFN